LLYTLLPECSDTVKKPSAKLGSVPRVPPGKAI